MVQTPAKALTLAEFLQQPETKPAREYIREQASTRVISNILYCLNHGGLGGWLIDPNENLVQVYLPNQLPASLEEAENELTMINLAPTLTLTVGQIFGWLRVR